MTISIFDGRYFWLSNFFPSPIRIPVGTDGVVCATMEHAFQAMKTIDNIARLRVATASSANAAKQLGQVVALRPDWEEMKQDVMEALLRQKFKDPVLRQKLLDTGDQELIEGNHWHDTYWGVCNGIGTNHLGKLLMKVRASL